MPKKEALLGIARGCRVKRLRNYFLCSFIAVVPAGCASNSALPCAPYEQPVTLDSLYFGTSKPGGAVTAEEWAAFLHEMVVPDFREGMTFWAAAGRWETSAGLVEREASYLLQLAHNGSEEKDRRVQRIAQRYKSRFQQEAVMRIRSQACRSF
ncbi:MAG: DUF3574 domain-containing protein [Nitrospira sp.]|nr:DUF3574 domain-containing protein [Nitrospira sp.]